MGGQFIGFRDLRVFLKLRSYIIYWERLFGVSVLHSSRFIDVTGQKHS